MEPPRIRPLFTAAQIADAVARAAREIEARFPGGDADERIPVLALLNGGLWFAADVLRHLPTRFELESVRVSSYGSAHESCGRLSWKSPMPDVRGRRVLVLDDVLDSGITLQSVVTALKEAGAAHVVSAVAVSKDACRRVPFEADVAALHAPDLYLVGYGMDDAGRYRNLPYIGYLQLK